MKVNVVLLAQDLHQGLPSNIVQLVLDFLAALFPERVIFELFIARAEVEIVSPISKRFSLHFAFAELSSKAEFLLGLDSECE